MLIINTQVSLKTSKTRGREALGVRVGGCIEQALMLHLVLNLAHLAVLAHSCLLRSTLNMQNIRVSRLHMQRGMLQMYTQTLLRG